MAFYINLSAMRLKVMDAAFSSVDEDTVFDIMEDCIEPDVAPVMHGRWIEEKRHSVFDNPYLDDNYHIKVSCSKCGFIVGQATTSFGYAEIKRPNFCEECGTKMDLK